MKKIKKEFSTTLTYKPFENIGELIKKSMESKNVDKEGKKR